MATSKEYKGCKYCRRPADCPPGPVMTHHRFHNEGCPVGGEGICDSEAAMAEWERGYAYGFGDNFIEPHRYVFFSKTFVLGWAAGKAEIDYCVEIAAESRYFE
jgi:hypothetical protein